MVKWPEMTEEQIAAIARVEAVFKALPDDQRLELLAYLMREWCTRCGRTLAVGETCHCDNDD